MGRTITNYDGSLVTVPQQIATPKSVEELQNILRQPGKYPSPVRAMGSYHSLTPCASSPGTVVRMEGMKKVVRVDAENMTFTGQAGMEIIEANRMLRKMNLQFILNIEIGNLTLGSAATCHTKDALDGVEFGQVGSYITAMKWVTPTGDLAEASEETNPELMRMMRGSYGLAGIVYEVTFKIKPLEIVSFNYEILDLPELTQSHIADVIASNQAMVCWTIENTVVIQTRNRASELKHEWLAESRRFGWNFLAAFTSRSIRHITIGTPISEVVEDVGFGVELGFYRLISKIGGFTLHDPDKTIDYSKTPRSARYAFTFWAFPKNDWVKNLNDYVHFRDAHFHRYGFRCNMPLGSYFVRQDTKSILSYTNDGDMLSLDPIHAPGDRDKAEWERFLREFNAWAADRGGVPLLNQSPFVERPHVAAAYGERWKQYSDWVKSVDPNGRLLNEFFDDLLV